MGSDLNKEIQPLRVSDVAQGMLFREIWSKMPQKSFISGLWLRAYANTPLWVNCLCYVLPLEKYRYFKYYAGALILVSPGERALWMQGTPEDRIQYALDIEEKSAGKSTANWNGVKLLETDLLELYKKNFPVTVRGLINYNYTINDQMVIVGRLNKEFWKAFK